jgi:MYXO-CTERM domain-containing protein
MTTMQRGKLRWAAAAAIAAGCVAGVPANEARAGTTAENAANYARLKKRLTTDFMVVGEQPGNSQPAPERQDTQGFIKWGDGTINLGWYMGILATEAAILGNPAVYPGADQGDAGALGKTLDELYYALAAMERLDHIADAAFPDPCTQTPSTNGFFLRDDVPDGFHSNFPGLTSTQSDFIDPTLTNKEMSQDQVYHLLMGFALVKHLVLPSVTVKGKALRSWAQEQSKRIGEHFAIDNWVIKNPACANRSVNRGEQAIGFSAGTRLAFSFISDGTYAPTTPLDVWDTLKSPNNPVYSDADNLHMAMAIGAVGNGWAVETAGVLKTLNDKQDWPLYPLLHRVLHGAQAQGFCTTTGTAINARARVMIDEMPGAGEPHNPRPGPAASHGFTVSNRFIRPKDQHYVGSPNQDGYRYSGTDFLLLHNLYAPAPPATWTPGPTAAPCTSPPSAVDAGADGAGGSSSSGGASSGSSGAPPGSGAGAGTDGAPEADSGCACGVAAPGAGTAAIPVTVLLVAAARRRRRDKKVLEDRGR